MSTRFHATGTNKRKDVSPVVRGYGFCISRSAIPKGERAQPDNLCGAHTGRGLGTSAGAVALFFFIAYCFAGCISKQGIPPPKKGGEVWPGMPPKQAEGEYI